MVDPGGIITTVAGGGEDPLRRHPCRAGGARSTDRGRLAAGWRLHRGPAEAVCAGRPRRPDPDDRRQRSDASGSAPQPGAAATSSALSVSGVAAAGDGSVFIADALHEPSTASRRPARSRSRRSDRVAVSRPPAWPRCPTAASWSPTTAAWTVTAPRRSGRSRRAGRSPRSPAAATSSPTTPAGSRHRARTRSIRTSASCAPSRRERQRRPVHGGHRWARRGRALRGAAGADRAGGRAAARPRPGADAREGEPCDDRVDAAGGPDRDGRRPAHATGHRRRHDAREAAGLAARV